MQTCRRTCFTPGGAFPGTEKTSRNCGFSEKMTYIYTLSRCTMLKLKPTLFLLAVLSLFSDRVSAAIEFRTLSVNEGLSQSTVLAHRAGRDGTYLDGYAGRAELLRRLFVHGVPPCRGRCAEPGRQLGQCALRRRGSALDRHRVGTVVLRCGDAVVRKFSASRGATCRSPTSPPRPAAT